MVESLIFSLDRVMPYFFLIVLGAFLRYAGIIPREFFEGANRFTFRVGLPFQLSYNIISIKRGGPGAYRYMLYILAITLVSFAVIWAVTELVYKDKAMVGTLVQGGFRGNFVLIGAPLVSSVLGLGATHTATLTSIVVIPSYNILSVIILAVRGKSSDKTLRKIAKDIISNPLIIGICIALPIMLLNIRLPSMVLSTMQYVGQTGTPLGLLSIGGMINMTDATARLRPALYASLIKNVLLPVVVVTVSYFIGFRGEELIVLLVLSASPVAISSYVMASEMGGDAPLASNILILSTFLSGFVLAAGIYLFKMFSLI